VRRRSAQVGPGKVEPGPDRSCYVLEWTAVTLPVRKLAHFVSVSNEALADFANFAQVVEQEMVAGLVLAENAQVLSGDGTGTNLTGLLATSGIQTYAPVAAEQRLLSILHGITLLRSGTSFLEADRIFVNPADWEIILKTPTTTGELIVSATPALGQPLSLWGVPVTVTSQVAAGTGIVANLAASTVVFSREPAKLFVDPYSASTNNLVKVIAEERLALGVTRPSGIVRITYNGAPESWWWCGVLLPRSVVRAARRNHHHRTPSPLVVHVEPPGGRGAPPSSRGRLPVGGRPRGGGIPGQG